MSCKIDVLICKHMVIMEQLLNALTLDFENEILAHFHDTWNDFEDVDDFIVAVEDYIYNFYNQPEYERTYDESVALVEEYGGIRTLMEINSYIKEYWEDHVNEYYKDDIDNIWNYYDDIRSVVNMFLYACVTRHCVRHLYEKNTQTNMEDNIINQIM